MTRRITALYELLRSPFLPVAVGVPAALWVITACYLGGMTLQDAASAVTFRIFFSILFLLLILHAGISLVRRSVARALVHGGIILLLVQGVVWYGFRFAGEAGSGTGDQIVDYHREQRGAWNGDSRIPARVESIPEAGDEPVVFSLGDKKINVPLKGSFSWNGYRISPLSVGRAPLMTLENAAGQNVEALYIKMGTAAPERDFFLVKSMPHRIYIAPDADRGIKLRIIRDKLEIAARYLPWGEKLYYDGHYIRFDRGEPWLRISVEKVITPWFAFAGGGMLLAGLISYLMKRRSAQC